jgi:hypothetical protein
MPSLVDDEQLAEASASGPARLRDPYESREREKEAT